MERRMKFEVRPSGDGQFYGVVVGGNGEDMFVGEMKPTKQSVKKAFRSLRVNALFAVVIDKT